MKTNFVYVVNMVICLLGIVSIAIFKLNTLNSSDILMVGVGMVGISISGYKLLKSVL